jgi:predicted alpha/beta hydrolase family esterase
LSANDQSQAILLYGYKNKPDDYWFDELWLTLAQKWINLSIPTITQSDDPDLDKMSEDVLWKIMIGEKTTIIGYSLWWLIACRLLEKTSIKIDRLILISTPRVDLDQAELQSSAERYGDRVLRANLDFDRDLIKSKVPSIIYVESTNDQIIPEWSWQYYVDQLGSSINSIDSQNNHFMWTEHQFVQLLWDMASPSQETFLVQEAKDLVAEVMSWLKNSYNQLWRNSQELAEQINQIFATEFTWAELEDQIKLTDRSDRLTRIFSDYFDQFVWSMLVQHRNQYLTSVYLDTIDREWIEHIDTMVRLREKVWLYGYAQQDPLIMYKQESYHIYKTFWKTVKERFVWIIFHHRIQNNTIVQNQEIDFSRVSQSGWELIQWDDIEVIEAKPVSSNVVYATPKKTRPNDPCPCGSGKKYKSCHWVK